MDMMGVMQQEQVVPAFTVSKLEGKRTKTVHMFDKAEKRIKQKVIEVDGGFLVKFAKGHSIRCEDVEHLKRIGAGARMVPLLDASGNEHGAIANPIADLLDEEAA